MTAMWVYGGALIPERSEIEGVRAIAAADPQFAFEDFLAFARTVHDNVHRATAARDLAPVAQLNHQDAQSAVLDVADHATVTHPVTP